MAECEFTRYMQAQTMAALSEIPDGFSWEPDAIQAYMLDWVGKYAAAFRRDWELQQTGAPIGNHSAR